MTTYPMDGRTVVITGGNSGIGLETCVGLAAAGARVVMGCRNTAKAETAVADVRRRSGNDAVESRAVDLADLRSVEAFADGLSDLDHVDVLINNAGLILDERTETAQGFEGTFGTNHLGHFHLTRLLLPQVHAAPAGRVVVVASEAHLWAPQGVQIADVNRTAKYSGWVVYGQSKLANVLFARALSRRLEGSGVVAHSLHPGSVTTNFGKEGDLGNAFSRQLMKVSEYVLISPEKGARTSIHVASSPDAATTSGDYWTRSRRRKAAPWGRDDVAAEALWTASERMVAAVS
jgi:NAD(P)-dependent dehydrogenase (short-subunit alcohol dehydrogenase family)